MARPEQGAVRAATEERIVWEEKTGQWGKGVEMRTQGGRPRLTSLDDDSEAFEADRLYHAGDNPEIFVEVEASDWTALDVAARMASKW